MKAFTSLSYGPDKSFGDLKAGNLVISSVGDEKLRKFPIGASTTSKFIERIGITGMLTPSKKSDITITLNGSNANQDATILNPGVVVVSLDSALQDQVREIAHARGVPVKDALQDMASQAAIGLGANVVLEKDTRLIASSNDAVLSLSSKGSRKPIRIVVEKFDPEARPKALRDTADRINSAYTSFVETNIHHGSYRHRDLNSIVINDKPIDPEQLGLWTLDELHNKSNIVLTSNTVVDVSSKVVPSERKDSEVKEKLRRDVEATFGIKIGADGEVYTKLQTLQTMLDEAVSARKAPLINFDFSNLKLQKLFNASLAINGSTKEEAPKPFLESLKDSVTTGLRGGLNFTLKSLAGAAVAASILAGVLQVGNLVNNKIPGAGTVASAVVDFFNQAEYKVSAEGIAITGTLESKDSEAIRKAQAEIVFKTLGATKAKTWVAEEKLKNAKAILDGKPFVTDPGVVERVSIMIDSAEAKLHQRSVAAAKVGSTVSPTP
jgi:hypothetical protein